MRQVKIRNETNVHTYLGAERQIQMHLFFSDLSKVFEPFDLKFILQFAIYNLDTLSDFLCSIYMEFTYKL